MNKDDAKMQVVSKYRISVIFKYFHLNNGKTFIVHYKYLHHAKLRSETKYRSDHDDEIFVTYSVSKDYGTCLAGLQQKCVSRVWQKL